MFGRKSHGWLALGLVLMLFGVFSLSVPIAASADPLVAAMNAPGGVFGRSAPDWTTPVEQTGFGLYDGTLVSVACWTWGTTVPGSTNQVWELVTDVGGPGYGTYWASEHFLNDGAALNQPTPGAPQCDPGQGQPNAPSFPQPPGPGVFSGTALGGNVRALPNVNSATYGTASAGSPLTVYCWVQGGPGFGIYETSKWFNVQVPGDKIGQTGFINASLVATPQPVVPECV